jgi:hypothetical protein
MPLDENPYFKPVMESIDMIAAENAQRQAQQQRFEQQQQMETTRFERETEREDKLRSEAELSELLNSVKLYQQSLSEGAKEVPGLSQAIEGRITALTEQGATPRMTGASKVIPQPPEIKEQEIDDRVLLDPKVAQFYKYTPESKVKPETRRILHKAYRDYFKPSKTGGGKQDKETDALGLIAKYREKARLRSSAGQKEPGDTEAVGIDTAVYSEYLNDLQRIEQDLRAGTMSKAEAIQELVALGTIDQFLYTQGELGTEADTKMDRIEDLLLKVAED